MAESSKRLEFLRKLVDPDGTGKTGSQDPFHWYGLAMEYRSLARTEEAFATFIKLRARAPDYVPMYLMCGQMLESMGRLAEARAWLTAGVDAARSKQDAHAESELRSALDALS
jgi:hypothetical protein